MPAGISIMNLQVKRACILSALKGSYVYSLHPTGRTKLLIPAPGSVYREAIFLSKEGGGNYECNDSGHINQNDNKIMVIWKCIHLSNIRLLKLPKLYLCGIYLRYVNVLLISDQLFHYKKSYFWEA